MGAVCAALGSGGYARPPGEAQEAVTAPIGAASTEDGSVHFPPGFVGPAQVTAFRTPPIF